MHLLPVIFAVLFSWIAIPIAMGEPWWILLVPVRLAIWLGVLFLIHRVLTWAYRPQRRSRTMMYLLFYITLEICLTGSSLMGFIPFACAIALLVRKLKYKQDVAWLDIVIVYPIIPIAAYFLVVAIVASGLFAPDYYYF